MRFSRRSYLVALALGLSLAWGTIHTPSLVVLPEARASLAVLDVFWTEHFLCLYGVAIDRHVLVTGTGPGITSTRSRGGKFWISTVTCPKEAIGSAHNHPNGERCYFYFPGTVVATADEVTFRGSGQRLSII